MMAHLAANIPWDFVLLFVLLGAVIPWRGAARIRKLLARPALTQSERLGTYASTIAFQWALTAIVVWRCAARFYSPQELGLVIESRAFVVTLAIFLAAFFGGLQTLAAKRMIANPKSTKSRLAAVALKIMPETSIESLVFVALAITAGVCEEFLYRGFVFAVINRAAGVTIAVIGSSAMFGFAHLYQGRRGLITTSILGVLFALSRVLSGSIVPAIVAHAVVDLVAGLVAVRYMRRAIAQEATRLEDPVAEPVSN